MSPYKKHVQFFFHSLIDFIFPPVCIVCDNALIKNEDFVCDSCLRSLPFNNNYLFDKDISSLPGTVYFSEFHWCIDSCEDILKIIHFFKYFEFKNLKNKLGEFLIDRIKKYGLEKKIDFILPVPLHKKRKKMRGYNQSSLLAEKIISEIPLAYGEHILKRIVNSKSQTRLTREERAQNVKGIFRVERSDEIKNKNLLLVDDVFTTGATVNECSRVLRENGAKSVTVLTVVYAGWNVQMI